MQGTSGNGTLTEKALRVLVGNNGATEAMTVLNNGDVGIGIVNPSARMHIVGPTLTSALATSALRITQTWNTTGSPTAIFANITNTASGALANLMDLQVGGVSQFKVIKNGDISANGSANLFGFATISTSSAGYFQFGSGTRSRMSSSANGNILFQNASLTDFGLLQFGGTTSSFPSLKRSGAGLIIRLADDSANAALQALTLKATQAAGYISSDGSTGATGSFTTVDLKTVTVKDGIITSIV